MTSRQDQTLRGVTVVVTRSREQNPPLRRALESRGAEVVSLPTLRFTGVAPDDEVRAGLESPGTYDLVIFTSQVAVRFFAELARDAGAPAEAWRRSSFAAVGPATAAALEELGWSPAIVARGGSGEALARELLGAGRVGPDSHVLIPQSAIARPELSEALRAAGVRVTATAVYETVTEEPGSAEPFLTRVERGAPPDAVLFASPSAVGAFLELTGEVGERFLARAETLIVAIGRTTSRAVEDAGYRVRAQAKEPGVDGMVRALKDAVREK